jgi:hypothetical protein
MNLRDYSSGRDVCSSSTEVVQELNLYRDIANDTVDDGVIDSLSLEQIKAFLLVLVRRPLNRLLDRISKEKDIQLLRRLFWLTNANHENVHTYYSEYVMRESPRIQKLNTVKFFQHLKEAEEKMRFDNLHVFCPLFPSRVVQRVDVVKRFTSGHGPMLLSMEFKGLPSLPVNVVYKPDECRADAACMMVFRVFNRCWQAAKSTMKLCPYAYTFEVCPLEESSGIIEYIPGAVELQGWDCANILNLSRPDLMEFVRSAAGSYVACYIMGCRDRHKSNFMIKDKRTFLQIDFKHCFDRQTRGVDAPHFSVLRGMKKALKEREAWGLFKKLCQDAFKVLRRRTQLIIRICLQAFEVLCCWLPYFATAALLCRGFVVFVFTLRRCVIKCCEPCVCVCA